MLSLDMAEYIYIASVNTETGGNNGLIRLLLLALMRRIEFSRLIYITHSMPKNYTNRIEQQIQVIKGQDMKPIESSSFIFFFLILAKD